MEVLQGLNWMKDLTDRFINVVRLCILLVAMTASVEPARMFRNLGCASWLVFLETEFCRGGAKYAYGHEDELLRQNECTSKSDEGTQLNMVCQNRTHK